MTDRLSDEQLDKLHDTNCKTCPDGWYVPIFELIAQARLANHQAAEIDRLKGEVERYQRLESRMKALDIEAWEAGGGVPGISWAEHTLTENQALKAQLAAAPHSQWCAVMEKGTNRPEGACNCWKTLDTLKGD